MEQARGNVGGRGRGRGKRGRGGGRAPSNAQDGNGDRESQGRGGNTTKKNRKDRQKTDNQEEKPSNQPTNFPKKYPQNGFTRKKNNQKNTENKEIQQDLSQKKLDGRNNNKESQQEKKSVGNLIYLFKRPIRHQHDARKLIMTCLEEKNKEQVLEVLAANKAQIDRILDADYHLQAGNKSQHFSFQRVLTPFLKLISHPEYAYTMLAEDYKSILSLISEHNLFFWRSMKYLNRLMDNGTLYIEPVDAELLSWNPTTAEDIFLPICSVLKNMLKKLTNLAAEDRVVQFFGELETFNEKYKMLFDRKKSKEIDECLTFIAKSLDKQDITLQKAIMKSAVESQREIKRVPVDLPGDMRDDGPRHNNDHADFRDISILPTQEETMSDIFPYLPFSPLSDSTDDYLDRHFRLLREDSLLQFKKGIKHVIESGFGSLKDGQHSIKYSDGRQKFSIMLYRNAQVTEMLYELRNGLCFEIQFDDISTQTKSSKKMDYWKESKLLQPGSIVY